jgi:prenyltransferase beta subunit
MVDALELVDEHASASFSCSCQGAHGGFAKYPNVEAHPAPCQAAAALERKAKWCRALSAGMSRLPLVATRRI